MIFASSCREACCLALCHAALICVELQQLVCALTHLSFFIEHEAASEGVDLTIEGNRSVALATLHRLSAHVGDSFPNDLITKYLGADNLAACIVVQTAHEIHSHADRGQSGALTRSRQPLTLERNLDFETEILSLLHSLDEMLETAHKLVDEFVFGNIVGRINSELLGLFLVAGLLSLVDEARSGASVLDPLRNQATFFRLKELFASVTRAEAWDIHTRSLGTGRCHTHNLTSR